MKKKLNKLTPEVIYRFFHNSQPDFVVGRLSWVSGKIQQRIGISLIEWNFLSFLRWVLGAIILIREPSFFDKSFNSLVFGFWLSSCVKKKKIGGCYAAQWSDDDEFYRAKRAAKKEEFNRFCGSSWKERRHRFTAWNIMLNIAQLKAAISQLRPTFLSKTLQLVLEPG